MNIQHFTEQVARIRKPSALLKLIEMVSDLPAPPVKQPAPGVIA